MRSAVYMYILGQTLSEAWAILVKPFLDTLFYQQNWRKMSSFYRMFNLPVLQIFPLL